MSNNKQECDIYACIGFLATTLRNHIAPKFDALIAPLTHKHAGILWRCLTQEYSQNELCAYSQSDKNYVRMRLDDLEALGLVKRKQNPNNRRENLISLSKKGEEIAQKSYELMLEVHNEILLQSLGAKGMAQLQELLFKAVKACEQAEPTQNKSKALAQELLQKLKEKQ
ncbi:MarR family winged helix-turn-helix transcriptional regulator [Campylobacter sp. VTCC 70190]|uniref:MarR family winged helix-turn-helix transcriptional regulator n=1 Tax=Campylobacter sp. VTCC 70190 TaxID=3392118 RepID=UPI00398E9947